MEGVLRSIYEDIKAHTFVDKFIGVELWCMLNLSAYESWKKSWNEHKLNQQRNNKNNENKKVWGLLPVTTQHHSIENEWTNDRQRSDHSGALIMYLVERLKLLKGEWVS